MGPGVGGGGVAPKRGRELGGGGIIGLGPVGPGFVGGGGAAAVNAVVVVNNFALAGMI